MKYAIINQKGGVAKSSTAQALAAGLTQRGYKALVVDLDPQGNTTFSLGANKGGTTALGVLLGEAKPQDAIQHTRYGDVIAGALSLALADTVLTQTGKEYRLKEALEQIQGDYDYIVIDTPPTLGVLTINALTAADSVIIPAQPDTYSLQGVGELEETIQRVRKYVNPGLKIEGILLTRYDSRSSAFNKELAGYAAMIAERLGTKIFQTPIRESIIVKKAQAMRQSLFDYDSRAKVTQDYNAFIKELLGEE